MLSKEQLKNIALDIKTTNAGSHSKAMAIALHLSSLVTTATYENNIVSLRNWEDNYCKTIKIGLEKVSHYIYVSEQMVMEYSRNICMVREKYKDIYILFNLEHDKLLDLIGDGISKVSTSEEDELKDNIQNVYWRCCNILMQSLACGDITTEMLAVEDSEVGVFIDKLGLRKVEVSAYYRAAKTMLSFLCGVTSFIKAGDFTNPNSKYSALNMYILEEALEGTFNIDSSVMKGAFAIIENSARHRKYKTNTTAELNVQFGRF